MEPTKELVDAIYRERVQRARTMTPEQRAVESVRLFDYACRITMDGIRNQHPEADEARVREILADRLALGRRLEGRKR